MSECLGLLLGVQQPTCTCAGLGQTRVLETAKRLAPAPTHARDLGGCDGPLQIRAAAETRTLQISMQMDSLRVVGTMIATWLRSTLSPHRSMH